MKIAIAKTTLAAREAGHYTNARGAQVEIASAIADAKAGTAMYSPRVPFFRADDGGWLDAPVLASVITCPALSASAVGQHRRFDAGGGPGPLSATAGP